MISRLLIFTTFSSALGSGLVAGLFFAFSAFVMTALSRLPAEQGIAAMQSINITVLNPLFSFVFFGTTLACIFLTVYSFFKLDHAGAIYLLFGSMLFLLGSFMVTVVFNVPLNDSLAAVAPNSHEGADLWTRYTTNWTAWNHVRTVASLAALASFIIAYRNWE